MTSHSSALVTVLAMTADDIPADLLQRIEREVAPVWTPGESIRSEAQVLVTANADLNANALSLMPQLKAIVTTGTAYDYIDTAYCQEHGIVVCNTPGYTGSSVAEHAIALMLSVTRHLPTLDAEARSGGATDGLLATELEGKVAGVIGLGYIGTRIARLAQCFGMEVLFASRSTRHLDGARQASVETLLQDSDVVFLSLPFDPAVGPLVRAAELDRMKKSAIIVNISADELIDRDALAAALASGHLGGAGLDVVGSPAPYADLPNTVITPASGWYTQEAVYRRAATWVGTLCSIARGHPAHQVA